MLEIKDVNKLYIAYIKFLKFKNNSTFLLIDKIFFYLLIFLNILNIKKYYIKKNSSNE